MKHSAVRALLALLVIAGAAGCAPDPVFDAHGLVPPSAQCPVDPKLLAEASQLNPVDEGNGCQVPNPWLVKSVAGVKLEPLRSVAFFRGGPILNCGMLPPLNSWVEGVAQPAARQTFGEPIRSMKVVGSYFCKARNGVSGAKMSEHGFGNAIDLSEFTLASGRTIAVASGWQGSPEERAFLRQLDRGACEHFTTVLGPETDKNHQGHFHLDLANRADGRRICE